MIRLIITSLTIFSLLFPTMSWADDDAVMDVDDSRASFSGTWHSSTFLPCAIGGAYRYVWGSSGNPTATFETEQTADVSGYYAVYARWSSYHNRNNQARYRIYDGSTWRATKYVDQTSDGCNWRYLATVWLTYGNKGKVVLDPNGAAASKATIADAVRFVRITKDGADIANSSITGADIQDNSITSADIANNSIRDYDIVDEPGIEYINGGSFNETDISTSHSSTTNLRFVSLLIPTSGYVFVTATGFIDFNASNKYVALCLDDSSGGSSCDTPIHYLGTYNAGSTSADQHNFALTHVYYYSSCPSGGCSRTYYLKAYRQSGSDFNLYVDTLTAMFFPTNY